MRSAFYAASLFLVASLAAPSSSAGVVGFVDDTCDGINPTLSCALACDELFLALASCYVIDGIPFPPGGIPPTGPLYQDDDNDNVPDLLEAVLCGSAAQRTAIAATGQASCASASDLVLAPDLSPVTGLVGVVVGILLGVVGTVQGLVDADGDLVADAAEPYLCLVENQNFPQDGSCTGNDYHPYP